MNTKESRNKLIRWTGYFCLFNLLLFLVISTRYLTYINVPEGALHKAFTVAAFIGHFSSLVFLPCIILIPLAIVLPRRLPLLITATGIYSLLCFVLLGDTYVYALYRFHINGIVMGFIFGGAAGDIFEFHWSLVLITCAIALGFILLEWVAAIMIWKWLAHTQRRLVRYVFASMLIGIFALQNIAYAWADVHSYTPITLQEVYLPMYRPLTARGFVRRHKEFFKKTGFLRTDNIGASPLGNISAMGSSINYPLKPVECVPKDKPVNIMVILVDSMRYDIFNPVDMPNLSSFAKDSWVFTNHIAGGNATRPALMSIFYGIPATYGYWTALLTSNTPPVLTSKLLAQGYEFSIHASASLHYPEFDRTVFSGVKGLRVKHGRKKPSLLDLDATKSMRQYLRERGGRQRMAAAQGKSLPPFFGFMFYDAPHNADFPPDFDPPVKPYWKAINYLKLNNDFDVVPYFNRYRNSVRFVDTKMGEVLQDMANEGLLDNTIVLITGDHSDEFNDTGLNFWGHGGNFTPYQVHVPMVIRWPGNEPRTFAHRTSHLDIAPTLLSDALGCDDDYSSYSVGRDLLDPGGREHIIIGGHYKYAVYETDRITLVGDEGYYIKDHAWRDIKGAQFDPDMMKKVVGETRKFYQ